MGMFCNYIINAFSIYPIVRVIKLHSAKEDGSHPVFTYLIIRENKNKTHLFFRWVLFLWSGIDVDNAENITFKKLLYI